MGTPQEPEHLYFLRSDRLRPALALAAASFLLYVVYGAVYRLFLCPVAKFPGPKLAALSFWYEFYYDVVKDGQYTFKLESLHEQYGPIVRINPYELHINDCSFYNTLYVSPRKTDKWEWSAPMFGSPLSTFATVSHDHHRLRRAMVAPFLSVAGVRRLESTVRDEVERLRDRLVEAQESEEVVPLTLAYSALTTDVITKGCFHQSWGNLTSADWGVEWYYTLNSLALSSHVIKQFPWLVPFAQMLPRPVLKKLLPDVSVVAGLVDRLRNLAEEVICSFNARKEGELAPEDYDAGIPIEETAMHQILASEDAPPSEKTRDRLADEIMLLVGAGTMTTAYALEKTTWHLLRDPAVLARLRAELATVMPTPDAPIPPLGALEALPYLTATVHEGLRASIGVMHRLTRVFPNAALTFGEWTVPAGTPVSMSGWFLNNDPILFPEPQRFMPERWLPAGAPVVRDRLRQLAVFGKGARQCLGIHLAHAEMYICLAAVVRRFGDAMELYDTVWERDLEPARDGFSPIPRPGSRGLRVNLSKSG